MSLFLGDNLISGSQQLVGESRNIGQIIKSTIPLTDAGLHLLDGSLIQGGGIYSAFVTQMAGLVSTFPDCFCSEANWQSSVATYGVCGKFVYDSVNNTIRLPKIEGFTEGTINPTIVGNITQAGLPDHRHTASYNGAATSGNGWGGGSCAYATTYSLTTSWASASNSIYGRSNTVQPQSIKVLYYIVIATTTKTNIEIDIDDVATDLNGKADVDLINVNSSGKILASSWAMPANRWIDLTLGASGATYTAPANGWMLFMKAANDAGQWIYMGSNNTSLEACGIAGASGWCRIFFPVKKGDSFAIHYTAAGSETYNRFIYAEGD